MLSAQDLPPAPSTEQDPNERCKHAPLVTEFLFAKYRDVFHKTMLCPDIVDLLLFFKELTLCQFSVFLSGVASVAGHNLHPNQAPVGSSDFHQSVKGP